MERGQASSEQHMELCRKNLVFFKTYFPEIHEAFHDFRPREAVMTVSAKGTSDLNIGGTGYYGGDAKQYAILECQKFLQEHCVGRDYLPRYVVRKSSLKIPRFASSMVRAHASDDSADATRHPPSEFPRGLSIPNFFPSVVVLGVGLGFHIEHLLKERAVVNLYILEPDPDSFAASLHAIDWEETLASFINTNARRVSFSIGGLANIDAQWRLLWNYLIGQCPTFPNMTHFYTHRSRFGLAPIIRKVENNIPVFTAGWGNYDDEINQLNQAVHNLKIGGALLESVDYFRQRVGESLHLPVCIIGSGPSLDARLEWVSSEREQLFLISCGSSITALYSRGIKPDLHIELESDYLFTVGYLETIDDSDYLDDILLIAPLHINPHVVGFFNKVIYFVKADSGTFDLFEGAGSILEHSGPTCTNLALTVVLKYGFTRVALMGMDFGFTSVDHHHATNSVYDNEKADDAFRQVTDYQRNRLIEMKSVEGRVMYAPKIYYVAKCRVEARIQSHRIKNPNDDWVIYNCSDGAAIAGATHLSLADQNKILSSNRIEAGSANKHMILEAFIGERVQVTDMMLGNLVKTRLDQIEKTTADLISILVVPIVSSLDFVCRCNRINLFVERDIRSESPGVYHMIRGTVYSLLSVGLNAVLERDKSEVELTEYMENWRVDLITFFGNLPKHAGFVLNKNFDVDTDEWLKLTIEEAPKDEPFVS